MTWFARKSRDFHKFNTIWPPRSVSGRPSTLATIKITVDGRGEGGNELNVNKTSTRPIIIFFFFNWNKKNRITVNFTLKRSAGTWPMKYLIKRGLNSVVREERDPLSNNVVRQSPLFICISKENTVNNAKYYRRWIKTIVSTIIRTNPIVFIIIYEICNDLIGFLSRFSPMSVSPQKWAFWFF